MKAQNDFSFKAAQAASAHSETQRSLTLKQSRGLRWNWDSGLSKRLGGLSGLSRPGGLSVGLGMAIALFSLTGAAFAQTTEEESLDLSSPTGMFELMRRIDQSSSQNLGEFKANSREIVNDEARDFRARQLELMRLERAETKPGSTEAIPEVLPEAAPETTPGSEADAASEALQPTASEQPYRALW